MAEETTNKRARAPKVKIETEASAQAEDPKAVEEPARKQAEAPKPKAKAPAAKVAPSKKPASEPKPEPEFEAFQPEEPEQEGVYADQASNEAQVAQELQPSAAPKKTVAQKVSGTRDSVVSTLDAVSPGHSHAIGYGLLGLVIALLAFWLGFWRTLVVAFFVLVGVAIGQAVDGDPKIINAIKRLITARNNEE